MKQSRLLQLISSLTDFQRNQLYTFLIDSFRLNEEDKDTKPDIYTYCSKASKMIKRGFRHGKQRYECKDCHHVFVYNSHTLTMYSKIDHSMFSQIILDTLNCVPLKKTAAKLNISAQSVFKNRHKFLCALEALLDSE